MNGLKNFRKNEKISERKIIQKERKKERKKETKKEGRKEIAERKKEIAERKKEIAEKKKETITLTILITKNSQMLIDVFRFRHSIALFQQTWDFSYEDIRVWTTSFEQLNKKKPCR